MSKTETQRLSIQGTLLPAGERTNLEMKAARLPTGTWLTIPVAVVRGARPGPTIWLSAALHGDELNGIEIVRQVLPVIDPSELRGTVIAAPIVNVFGLLNMDRYLPDRRDLNRSFPGSRRGSLAARIAHLFVTEIVEKCDYGIDLHTGSHHRTNLPQIRGDTQDPETRKLIEAFHAPIAIRAKHRDGSLRQVAIDMGKKVLVYEAGETQRFDRESIEVGVMGILRVLGALKMVPRPKTRRSRRPKTRLVSRTRWARAPRAGFLLQEVKLGQHVTKGQVVARVTDTFSDDVRQIKAQDAGVVIGLSCNPVVNRGDAVVHLAMLEESEP